MVGRRWIHIHRPAPPHPSRRDTSPSSDPCGRVGRRPLRLVSRRATFNLPQGENAMQAMILAEYIWIDGAVPVRNLRSKTRVVAPNGDGPIGISTLPVWSFDGSSTYQAT